MDSRTGFIDFNSGQDLVNLFEPRVSGPTVTTTYISQSYSSDLGSIFIMNADLGLSGMIGTVGNNCGYRNKTGYDLGSFFYTKDTVCSQLADASDLIVNGNFDVETLASPFYISETAFPDGLTGWKSTLGSSGYLYLAKPNYPVLDPYSNVSLPTGAGTQFLGTDISANGTRYVYQYNVPFSVGNYCLSFYHNGKPTNGIDTILKCSISIIDANNNATDILSNLTTTSTLWQFRTVIFNVSVAGLNTLRFTFNNTSSDISRMFNLACIKLVPILPKQCAALYAYKLVNLNYTGPIVRLRRSADTNTNANNLDFYVDKTGTVVKALDNTTLSAWMALNSSTSVFVHTWYDQSGLQQNATQTDTTLQPEFDITGKSIYFNSKLMDIPSTILPEGNSAYSVNYKLNNTPTISTVKYLLSIGDNTSGNGLNVSLLSSGYGHSNGSSTSVSKTPALNDFVSVGYNKTNTTLTINDTVATPSTYSGFNLTQNTNATNVIGGLLKSSQSLYASYLLQDVKIGYLGIYRNIPSALELNVLKNNFTATIYVASFSGIVNGGALVSKPTVGLSTGTYSGYIIKDTTIPASFGWSTDASINTTQISLFNVADISSFSSVALSGFTKCLTLQSITYSNIFNIYQKNIYFPVGSYVLSFSAIGRNTNGVYDSAITKLSAGVGYTALTTGLWVSDKFSSGTLTNPTSGSWKTYSLGFSITSAAVYRDLQIRYENTGSADNMVLLSGLSITSGTPIPDVVVFSGVLNRDFSLISPQPATNNNTAINPTITNWTKTGTGNIYGCNGTSTFACTNLPSIQYVAMQVASINTMSLTQTLTLPVGTYSLSFYSWPRPGTTSYYTTCSLSVSIGSTPLVSGLTFTAGATTTSTLKTIPFTITSSGSYDLTFSTSNTLANDSTIVLAKVNVINTGLGFINPLSVYGCSLWLDAADTTTLFTNADGTGAVTGTTTGVKYWKNKADSVNNATWSNNSGTPALNNTAGVSYTAGVYPSLTFGANVASDISLSFTGISDIFVVSSHTAATYGLYYGMIGGEFAGQSYFCGVQNATTFVGQGKPPTIMYNGGTTAPASAASLTMFALVGGSGSTLLNPNLNSPGLVGIGRGDSTLNRWLGTIREVLIYTSPLSNSNRLNIEGYLAKKWGLQTLLPSTHPYYNALVLYYPFNTDFLNYATGSGVATGTSVALNTLTTTEKKFGTGSYVANVTQSFNLSSIPIKNTNGYTFSMWCKMTSLVPNSQVLLLSDGSSPTNKVSVFFWNGSSCFHIISGTTTNVYLNSMQVIFVPTVNVWFHFAFTINKNSDLVAYINGQSVTIQANNGTPVKTYLNTSLTSSYLSGYAGTSGNGFPGYVDEFYYYDGILNSTQISNLYSNNDPGQQLGLLPYLPTGCVGLFACKWVNNGYSGPILKLRKSSDTGGTSMLDFYIDKTGVVVSTGVNGAGTSFDTWLGTDTAYVNTWYDQSGQGNHGIQPTIAYQPKLVLFNGLYTVYFYTSGGADPVYLGLTKQAFATGNNSFTIISKLADTTLIPSTGYKMYFSTGSNANYQIQQAFSNRIIQHTWYGGNGATYTPTWSNNLVISCDYNSASTYSKNIYLNGSSTPVATLASGTALSLLYSTSLPDIYGCIGAYGGQYLASTTTIDKQYCLTGSISHMSLYNTILGTTNRQIIENIDSIVWNGNFSQTITTPQAVSSINYVNYWTVNSLTTFFLATTADTTYLRGSSTTSPFVALPTGTTQFLVSNLTATVSTHSITQSVNIPAAGIYTLTFYRAGRTGTNTYSTNHTLAVDIGTQNIVSVLPTTTATTANAATVGWQLFTGSVVITSAGNKDLKFTFTNSNTVTTDSSYYITGVALNYVGASYTGEMIPPPVAPTSDNFTISNQTGTLAFKNGNYVASASSRYETFYPYLAFNNVVAGSFWHVQLANGVNGYPNSSTVGIGAYTQNPYNASGIYQGGGNANVLWQTTISDTSYQGEWLQIQLPYSFVLTSHTYIQRDGYPWTSRGPKLFYVAGSNNGNTWFMLHQQDYTGVSDPANSVQGASITYPVSNNSTYYSYYRIVVNKSYSVAIHPAEWKLSGYM